MKECLHCKGQFEEKRESAKFCSTSCRVMFNRKNKGKSKLVFKSPSEVMDKLAALDLKIDKILYQTPTPESYDGKKMNPVNDEPLSFSKLKAEIQPQDKYGEYAAAIQNAQDMDELEAVGRRIKASGLLWKEKQNLQLLGQQIAKLKFI